MEWCHSHQQEIVVHGGLTNLVGGTQTHPHQLVVSIEKMNQVGAVDSKNRTATNT